MHLHRSHAQEAGRTQGEVCIWLTMYLWESSLQSQPLAWGMRTRRGEPRLGMQYSLALCCWEALYNKQRCTDRCLLLPWQIAPLLLQSWNQSKSSVARCLSHGRHLDIWVAEEQFPRDKQVLQSALAIMQETDLLRLYPMMKSLICKCAHSFLQSLH